MIGIAARIRPARPGDAHGIARVHVETWQDAYAGLVPDAYILSLNLANRSRYWQQTLAAGGDSQEILVVQDEAGKLVAFASAGPARKRNLPIGRQFDSEIFTLYVAPNVQGQGLGKALFFEIFSALAKRGCLDAFLWVLSANPSRFFYEAMGGQKIGERTEKFAGADLAETAYGWDTLLIDA